MPKDERQLENDEMRMRNVGNRSFFISK